MNGAPRVRPPDGLIADEQAYPVYRYTARISRLLTAKFVEHVADSQLVRDPNASGVRFMDRVSGSVLRERELLPRELVAERMAVRRGVLGSHPDAVFYDITFELDYWETWCVGWFSHRTFPRGRSDAELVASFSRYVDRHERYQDYLSDRVVDPDTKAVCLMGAEDRWRWCGEDRDRTEGATPICRCAGCLEQGVVRVNH